MGFSTTLIRLSVIDVVCQQIRWRLDGRSHGRSHAHSTVRQLCDISGEAESRDWPGESIVGLHPDRRVS